VRATIADALGALSTAVAPVLIDTEPPTAVLSPPTPSATARGPVVARVSSTDPSGLSAATLTVASQTGLAIGRARMVIAADGASASRRWNLRLRRRLLLPGVYRLAARVTDGAGNTATSTVRLLRVSRPVKARIVYSLPGAGNAIALSFDDCVDGAAMRRIIRAFRAAGARTTFFCNGVNIAAHADAMRAALAAGDTIGAHTWSHKELPDYPAAVQGAEMQGDIDAWWSVARAAPTPLLRPPYGLWSEATLRAAGQRGFAWVVLWNVDPSDYLDPPRAVLVQRVLAEARPGAIVVMHVNANTAAAVPALIRGVRALGLEPRSIDEMLGPAAYLSPASG
jgi:peptidoglycan/xylan/chitin deacetylase (PgdA/CDA1 family)